MSYEIVKGLRIDTEKGEVFIKASSSNVEPKTYDWEEMKGLSALLRDEGKEAVIKLFVRYYWEGTFQPGTYNMFHKASVIFQCKNPDIGYSNVGEVLDEDLWFCPLEDIPKYLGYKGRRTQDYVKRRLEGETFDRDKDIPVITMTKEDMLNKMYDIYMGYRSRKKGKFVIDQGSSYFAKPLSKHRWYNGNRDQAKEFDSWEEAAVMCHRYSLGYENISEEK